MFFYTYRKLVIDKGMIVVVHMAPDRPHLCHLYRAYSATNIEEDLRVLAEGCPVKMFRLKRRLCPY